MHRCTILLPLQIVYLFETRQTFGQFNIPSVQKLIKNSQPKKIEQALKDTTPNDIVHAIENERKHASRDVMNAVGTVEEASSQAFQRGTTVPADKLDTVPLVITTTSVLPVFNNKRLGDAFKDTIKKGVAIVENTGKNIPDVKEATPKELVDTIRDNVEIALQDENAKEAITALKGGDVESVPKEAAKENTKKLPKFLDAQTQKGFVEAIQSIDAFKDTDVKKGADALKEKVTEVVKDTNIQDVTDVLKNPSNHKMIKALENIGVTNAPKPGGEMTTNQDTNKSFVSNFSSVGTLVAVLLVGSATVGGLYYRRHFTNPRHLGLLTLEGNNDACPNWMEGAARELQPVQPQNTVNGFTQLS